MEPSVFLVGVVAFGAGGVVLGALGWSWGAGRARTVGEAALRDAEKRASAAGARAETLGDQARESEARANGLEAARRLADSERAAASARAEELTRSLAEQRGLIDTAKVQLADTFQALAADALQSSHQGFLALATERFGAVKQEGASELEARQKAIEAVVGPVRESLEKVDQQMRNLERERGQAYGQLTEQVRNMSLTNERLRAETGNLVTALRAPNVRGRWGELQLRRVVEMAGMLESCDFTQQTSVTTEDGRLRPDMVVRLPSGRNIVIDAKTPLLAYLEAAEAPTEEERTAKLKQHAAQVRTHVAKLGAKNYWEQFAVAPEVVVMFLPGEMFYSVALEHMPGLIEEGFAQNVLIATPTTLLGLLRAVSAGWREERIAENAQRISEEGRKLHERIAVLAEHFGELGKSLGNSVGAFNRAMNSFETRVIVSARKLEELDASGKKERPELGQIESRPVTPRRPETRAVRSAPLSLALSPAPPRVLSQPVPPTAALTGAEAAES
jgi:DNA recombination protein RmuC